MVNFYYDPNGARTNKTETVSTPSTNSTVSTAYIYDEDNRLTEVSDQGSGVSTFAYDYRSRRFYRATPSGTNLCIFDGGLSIQEYDAAGVGLSDFQPSTANLRTEFVRGEGMGGGVGGMVYSISTNGIICSHANHRGDVIARSDSDGSLTSFSRYEAYGTRPYEWGDDPDRQKANTKEEEKDLGLLNEGMRYRDLVTGTFLTRDPTGYKDGPNIYCYVHCNPITHFDSYGLSAEPQAGSFLVEAFQATVQLAMAVTEALADAFFEALSVPSQIDDAISQASGGALNSDVLEAFAAQNGLTPDDFLTIGPLAMVEASRAMDNVADMAHAVDKVSDTARVADKVSDTARAASRADDVADAANTVKNADNLSGSASQTSKISMDDAVSRGADHVGGQGTMETTGSGNNFQFRNTTETPNGSTQTDIARFDVNPVDNHVQNDGPHLNLETQVDGKTVSNDHIPIDDTTVRSGDTP